MGPIIIAVLAILVPSFVVPVQREMGWIDAVTASKKRQTYVTFGFDMQPLMKTTPTIETSPLADWLVQREGKIEFDWRHVNGTLKTIWGKPVGYGHDRSPPIYPSYGDLMKDFVSLSSDEDLLHFVEIMRHGSEEEQEAEVNAAIQKALSHVD